MNMLQNRLLIKKLWAGRNYLNLSVIYHRISTGISVNVDTICNENQEKKSFTLL
jgi:hypothetical protein